MNCILVPTLALDNSLLQRLADSIDYPIKNKVVINNGKIGALDEWKINNPEWQVYEKGINHGCAGSWNLAPILFPDDNAWLIINDDHVLQPGSLKTICRESDLHADDSDIIYVNEHQAFDIFVWTRNGVNFFGLFDENFYPIYYEDWEMRLRFKIGDAITYSISPGVPIKHGKPYPHNLNYMEMMKKCDPFNRDYFMRKWGVIGDEEIVYESPFNDPELPLSFWEIEQDRRDERMNICNLFFNSPDASIK